jgi:DNA-binding NarL/FixJ family response regulator
MHPESLWRLFTISFEERYSTDGHYQLVTGLPATGKVPVGVISMPVMNGFEAARALKLLMPQIPLLLFTNNVGVMMEQEARSAGISAVICKSDADSSHQLLVRAKALLNRPDKSSSTDIAAD